MTVLCTSPEPAGGRMWFSVGNPGWSERSPIYPQVLKRVLHIVVEVKQDAENRFPIVNSLNLHEIKKRLVNSHAIHSQWLAIVARIISLF